MAIDQIPISGTFGSVVSTTIIIRDEKAYFNISNYIKNNSEFMEWRTHFITDKPDVKASKGE